MDHATVALLLLAFSCAVTVDASAAANAAAAAPFGYPDDDHVIITQYGPMRYEPMSPDQLNRPYEHDGVKITPARGYYKAEVIPLDMKTWKPLSGGGSAGGAGSWVGRGVAGSSSGARAAPGPGRTGGMAPGPGRFGGGGGGGGEFDSFDVPLRVGYSVRPTKPLRRRRHDYFLTSPPHGYLHRYPGGRLPPQPAATEHFRRS